MEPGNRRSTRQTAAKEPAILKTPTKSSKRSATTPEKLKTEQQKKQERVCVTPPKQQRQNENKSPNTPTRMIGNLSLEVNETDAVCQSARRALHGSTSSQILCRDKEIVRIREFILKHAISETSASMYICGPPGTGKTACIGMISQEEYISNNTRHVLVNCTTIKSATEILSRICRDLGLKSSTNVEKGDAKLIENYLTTDHLPL